MKTKSYLCLYYICFILTFLIIGFASLYSSFGIYLSDDAYLLEKIVDYISDAKLFILVILNLILFIIFTILIIKKRKLNIKSLIFPISYIIFLGIVFGLSLLFNNKVVVPYIHFAYYQTFILIDYLLLNIYSLLCLTKND